MADKKLGIVNQQYQFIKAWYNMFKNFIIEPNKVVDKWHILYRNIDFLFTENRITMDFS